MEWGSVVSFDMIRQDVQLFGSCGQSNDVFQFSKVARLDHSVGLIDDQVFDGLDSAGKRVVLSTKTSILSAIIAMSNPSKPPSPLRKDPRVVLVWLRECHNLL